MLVPQGRDRGPAPKLAAVLANLPAHAVGPTARQGRPELMLRLAVAEVLRGEEAGEMLSDDFARLVAEQALRSGVPADQTAILSEQEDGVLLRICRQQVEALGQLLRREVVQEIVVHDRSFPGEPLTGHQPSASASVQRAVTFGEVTFAR